MVDIFAMHVFAITESGGVFTKVSRVPERAG